jgi:putative membrane protein
VLVLGLSAFHGWLVSYGKRLAAGGPRVDGRTLRLMNEIPGIAVIFIVVLVVVGRAFS